MKSGHRKLSLSRQTIRTLQGPELNQIFGGAAIGARAGGVLGVQVVVGPPFHRISDDGCCSSSSSSAVGAAVYEGAVAEEAFGAAPARLAHEWGAAMPSPT